ncbi:hypothetical protein LCGC14_2366250 [marine sediment metagenome]|uniref:Uncharacterized protein n=1 Tax=marine sediment metagenome TaxID=412755 RepID=A0A0F9EZX1_9ZZZZ
MGKGIVVVNMKTIMTRRAIEWENFLNSIIKAREERGEKLKLKKPELERIILHNFAIPQLKQDMINLEIDEREMEWMKA